MNHRPRPRVAVCLSLLICLTVHGSLTADEPSSTDPARQPISAARVELLDDAAAWQQLGIEPTGDGRCPVWARALATPLPQTTVAMLELDSLHRVNSPLEARLRAKVRWTAAHANRCAYGEKTALADLRRAGADESEIHRLVQEQPEQDASRTDSEPADLEQATLEFARRLTLAGSSVTDEQVAHLMEAYGDKQVVAIVLLVAYSNFLDRLLHAFGLADADDSSFPPPATPQESTTGTGRKPPPRTPPAEPPAADDAAARQLAEWSRVSFAQLQDKLDSQRTRKSRIKVPDSPGTSSQRRPSRVRWSLVCASYQPELASAWFNAMGTFARESQQDRVFEESLFWVITRSIDCFY